jgi:FAD/FMN-containing dehydrogenase
MFADAGEKATHDAWAAELAGTLTGGAPGGGYVGFLGDEPAETIRASYGGNWDRLRDLKRRYDPNNLFRLNHNIPPAESG